MTDWKLKKSAKQADKSSDLPAFSAVSRQSYGIIDKMGLNNLLTTPIFSLIIRLLLTELYSECIPEYQVDVG